jgi:hypothetical protein
MQRRGEDGAKPQRYTFARAVLPQRIKSFPVLRLTAIWEAFRVATASLRSNKLRTSLTLMGIVVGVTAVIPFVTNIKCFYKNLAQTIS